MSREINAEVTKKSKDQVGHSIIGITYDPVTKSLATIANAVRKFQRWGLRDLDQLPTGNIEKLLNNPRCVAATKDGLLVGDGHIFLISREGTSKVIYVESQGYDAAKVLPHYNDTFVIWDSNQGRGPILTGHGEYLEGRQIFGKEILHPVACMAMQCDDLLFTTRPMALEADDDRNIVYFADRAESHQRYRAKFDFRTEKVVDDMVLHEKTDSLVFVDKGGVLHFYDIEGNQLAEPLKLDIHVEGPHPGNDYTLATSRQGNNVYVAVSNGHIATVRLQRKGR